MANGLFLIAGSCSVVQASSKKRVKYDLSILWPERDRAEGELAKGERLLPSKRWKSRRSFPSAGETRMSPIIRELLNLAGGL